MDWTVKCLVLAICLTFSCASSDVTDAEVIHAVPAEVNTEPAVLFDKDRAGNEPIKYDGAQLWRIAYSDQEHKNAVTELQKQFKVSMWNLQMSNKTEPYVDMFVKSAMVKDARSFLETSRVPFDVVINDIQDAINTENPPLDEVEHWQNRNGELKQKLDTKSSFSNRRNFPSQVSMQIELASLYSGRVLQRCCVR